ncbi:MAG TPA: DUF177 domain-containing protein [Gemmatimonadales bacterium]|nr:DUF177 domain-containing protein [Gemmatimonadales bacterium]
MNIDEIKETGLERSWDVTREQLDEVVREDRAGYRAAAAAHVEARLEKLARRVRLRAATRAELTCPCGRCLAPVNVAVPVQFELTLVPAEASAPEREEGRDRVEGPPGGGFRAEEADEEPYRGKVIDLDPILREQILLSLPGYPVCRDGCKGLCHACGQDLNERECGCDRRVRDPRWAPLEKLKRQ